MAFDRFVAACLLAFSVAATPTAANAADKSGERSVTNQPPSVQSSGTVPRGVAMGSRSEEQRYAAREASSPDAKKYRAGDVIVISASAVAIVLIIILIIILI